METLQDVLHFAISKEYASEKFYTELAAAMTNPATQSLFRLIAKQESRHADVLKLEIMKAGYTVPSDGSASAIGSEYEWDERLELNDEAHHMSYIDALQLAIQKERAAFELYAQLVGRTHHLELRKVLLELAEEEMRHVLQFEHEYETVTHHHKE